MPKTKIQKAIEAKKKHLMSRARQEMALRHPEDKHEIMAGDWDQGMGMQGVLADLRFLGIEA